jgi:hypothetical protein
MHLYRGTGVTLAADIAAGILIPRLQKAFTERLSYAPGESEIRSWASSLPAVSRELTAAKLSDLEILIEYALPLNSKRIDVLLIGTHPKTGEFRR